MIGLYVRCMICRLYFWLFFFFFKGSPVTDVWCDMAKLRKGAGLPVLLPYGAKNTTCVFLRPPLTYLRLLFQSVRCPQVEHVPSPYIVCFSHIGVGIGEGERV
jgi:hypothetical protein